MLPFKKLSLLSLVTEVTRNVNARPLSDDVHFSPREIAQNGNAIAPLIVGGSDAEIGAYPYYSKWENNGASRSDDHRLVHFVLLVTLNRLSSTLSF